MSRVLSGRPPVWGIVVVCLASLHLGITQAPADAGQPLESAPVAASPDPVEPTQTMLDEPAAISLFLGRLHHLAIHFPLALLVTAMIIELFAAARRRALPTDAGLACLLLGALGAGVAAWFGWIHADVEVSDSAMLDTHRWLGISTAIVAGLTLATALLARCSSWAATSRLYLLGVLASAAMVAVTGHFGAAMIYGHTYFVEAFIDEQPPAVASMLALPQASPEVTTRSISYERDIRPIFEASCVKCHGPRRQRAKLRLDIPDGVFGRDAADWVIRPGDPNQSELIRRLELPASDEDHMPYKKSPLPPVQIERLRLWVLEGAVWGAFQPVPVPTASGAAAERGSAQPAGPILRPAPPEVLDALIRRGVAAARIADNTHAVEVNASLVGDSFSDADLALLVGLEGVLHSLSLARTGVTDDGTSELRRFTELRRLHLENTAIGDAALAAVGELKNLEYLNLYNTHVTDAGLQRLHGLRRLRRLYLWQTDVTDAAVAGLRDAIPGIEIDVGRHAAVTEPEVATAQAERIPDCCATAGTAGGSCDHDCCIEAASRGEVCRKCLGDGR